jgi:hypothetical protein
MAWPTIRRPICERRHRRFGISLKVHKLNATTPAAHLPLPSRDCGEGVHFAGGVAYSTIHGNYIAGNSGGILLSDDLGPTHNNLISNNTVTGNTTDCGITVPGHHLNRFPYPIFTTPWR